MAPPPDGMSSGDNDGFQSAPAKRNKSKRLYIGNLPSGRDNDSTNLQDQLLELVQRETQISLQASQLEWSDSCAKPRHVLVTCPASVMDPMIKKLNRIQFQGHRLVVHRERKQRQPYATEKSYSHKKDLNSPFGGTSWSGPSENKPERVNKGQSPGKTPPVADGTDVNHLAEEWGAIVQDHVSQADDPVTAVITSTAALTLVASVTDIGEDQVVQEEDDDENIDFAARAKQSMADLLGEYGQEDVNWKQVQPVVQPPSKVPAQVALPVAQEEQHPNRLGQQGKAPIHVEFRSFGYRHGAPPEIRQGGAIYNVPPVDCRDLPTVPPYLNWQDGLSGSVKFALSKCDPPIQPRATELASQVTVQIVEAIENGGHGYALPLKMCVLVGSDQGRHRSVVLCELAAVALRNLLRENQGGSIRQPCSVGTHHRDLERKAVTAKATHQSKQKALDDDDD